jgi:membrane protein insertase Oxa1/YidC/SpoIIIJ
MPIIFAYFYLVIPAAVVIYMIISTGIRIITQDIMFRTGISNPVKQGIRPVAAAAGEIEGTSEVVETKDKPSSPKPVPNRPAPKNRPSNQARPAPRPQQQPRSKAKRKRKAR